MVPLVASQGAVEPRRRGAVAVGASQAPVASEAKTSGGLTAARKLASQLTKIAKPL